jgi:hypothetical protein
MPPHPVLVEILQKFHVQLDLLMLNDMFRSGSLSGRSALTEAI